MIHLSRCVLLPIYSPMSWSYNPNRAVTWLVWALPRSLATTYGITIVFFSYGYLDVSVPRVRFPCGITRLQRAGLPHSEISGSKVICTFPKLIAACHVLHRLWEPRHSPCALSNFLNLFYNRCSRTSKKLLMLSSIMSMNSLSETYSAHLL